MRRRQCAKCLAPVRYNVTPAAAAAEVTTSSRTDPPGCTIAVTPAATNVSSPSGNGKNASDAATAPRTLSPPRSTASLAASTRFTWPMPTPTVAPSLATTIALDFTARQLRQANLRSASTDGYAGSPAASAS